MTLGLYLYVEGCYCFPPEGGEPTETPVNASGEPVTQQVDPNQTLTGFLAKKAMDSFISKFTG